MSADMLLIIKLCILFGVMLFFLFLKVPIFLSLAGASITYALIFPGSVPLSVFSQSLAQGIGKETYICIIFYFLLGEVMNCGGITTRIVDLGRAAIGWIPGYLSHINVISSVIFAGVSGSANADTAAIGSLMIPMMKEEGYPAGYAAAVTEMSSVIGPIIPPSSGLVMLAVYMNCSARKLLTAGLIPGLMMGAVELILSLIISRRRHFPKTEWEGTGKVWSEFKRNFWAILLPVVTIYCLVAGIGTVTEVGALSCAFGFFIAIVIYREMNFKQFLSCFMNCCTLVGRVLCSIATAGVFVYIISSMGAARKLSAMVASSGLSATGTLLICILILFLLGMILNVNVLLMVIVPVMVPTILAMGINPLHFGIITMLVVQLGVNTPPVGSLIYLTASIADCPASEVIKESLPYLVVLVALIIVWVFCPGIITFLPNLIH